MCKLVRKLTTVLLAVVFAVTIGFVIHQFTQYDQAEESHLQAQELAVKPETTAPIREIPDVTVPLSTAPQPDEAASAMLELYRKGTITRDVALEYADNPDQMLRRIEL